MANTQLEDLPNELFCQLFSYLTGVDAVFAFSFLNTRFQCLLEEFCREFDFQSIEKTKFDWIFNQYDEQCGWIQSLKLSNEDIPGQIEYFFQCYSLLDGMSQLKSLSLLKIESIFLSQISMLTNLVSLTLKPICGRILSNINLPPLKRLAVASCSNTEWTEDYSQLESLEYEITNCCSKMKCFVWPRQLKHLKVVCKSCEESRLIFQSLRNLSDLITLGIYQKELGKLVVDGAAWEDLIRSSFPLLQRFKFFFPFHYSHFSPDEIHRMMFFYSSSFYIDEKKWSIRCDVFANYGQGAIYSLPFTFDQFILFNDLYEPKILTLLNQHHNAQYKRVKTLLVESLPYSNIDYGLFDRQSILALIRHDSFISVERFHFFPNACLYRQRRHVDHLSSNLVSLIKHMPRLYSLEIRLSDLRIVTNEFTDRLICEHLGERIRSLKLHQNKEGSREYFNEPVLNRIIRTFATKCQYLSISIPATIETAVALLQNMQQLQSLHLVIEEKSNAELMKNWLMKHGLDLSQCFITNFHSNHYFWLTKE